MHLVDRQYSRHPYEGSGWWASLNVALAIAHRLRVMSNLVPQEEDEKGWAYLKNALAVQSELTIKNTDLLSVQALLGMVLWHCVQTQILSLILFRLPFCLVLLTHSHPSS